MLVLCPPDDGLEIDTWVMSCRVLNRTVEEGVFSWLCGVYEGVKLFGIYTPTQKNALVKDHFKNLGFKKIASRWEYLAKKDEPVKHKITTFSQK